MQVVSGPVGRRKVHFEAPPAQRLDAEMTRFLEWFELSTGGDPLVHAGLAHLWFVTLHPFDDGNGRIARAVGDMALARAEGSSQRFYSLSAQIQRERQDYYEMLERTQKGSMDVTPWLAWFLGCLLRAIEGAETSLSAVLGKSRFWQRWADDAAERAAGQASQPPARRLRGQADEQQVGCDRKVFARYRAARHQRTRRARRAEEIRFRRTQHQL